MQKTNNRLKSIAAYSIYRRRNKIIVFSLIVTFALTAAGCRSVRQSVQKMHMTNGIAVSLNSLEQTKDKSALLPPMVIRGITIDRVRKDWIIFGDYDPAQKRIPVDAVKVAINAVRLHLDAPGVDIRPRNSADQNTQAVTYFGGVQESVVGSYFFVFDYWMKQAALGDAPVIPEIPVYWHRIVHSAENADIASYNLQAQGTRFWLCAGEFTGKEEKDTLTFENTPLHVFAERLKDSQRARRMPPCATQGADDRFADEFARSLNANLDNLQALTPISQIKSFARLFGAITWASQRDPFRDLNPWLTGPIKTVNTPTVVPTISKHHRIVQSDGRVIRTLHLEVSGGVSIAPRPLYLRGYDLLLRLGRAVLAARPTMEQVTWSFKFDSETKN